MPEAEYVWIPREQVLTFEEISRLVDIFVSLGVQKLRLTGGEPLLRRDLTDLVRALASKPAVRDLALTTNGVLLAESARSLSDAGLDRATVSLDSLRADRLRALCGSDALPRILQGIEAARAAGFTGLKLNAVIMRGFNDDELTDLIEYGRRVDAEVRFIEYMDVGGATRWSMDQVFGRGQMLARLSQHYGSIEPIDGDPHAPAERFRLPDGTCFGIIASTTAPFCRSCDRARLTADGMWYRCLYATDGFDLRGLLRGGASNEQIAEVVSGAWRGRVDRGAEERAALRDRGPLVALTTLRKNYHLEMHTRGG
jgi:cyclic pyranopterin phosphate synthase